MDTLTPSFVEETNHMRSSEEEEEKEDGDEEHQEEDKGRMNYARVHCKVRPMRSEHLMTCVSFR